MAGKRKWERVVWLPADSPLVDYQLLALLVAMSTHQIAFSITRTSLGVDCGFVASNGASNWFPFVTGGTPGEEYLSCYTVTYDYKHTLVAF